MRRKGGIVGTQEIFRTAKLFLNGTIMMDTRYYTFFKTHRVYKTKNEP